MALVTRDDRMAAGRNGVGRMTAAGVRIAGRYRVDRPLAAGGLGHVWLGIDERTGRTVAMKKCALPEGLAPQQHAVVRVWVPREARAFARIRHPNVIRTLDVLLDGDAPWIIMEYVPSRSLLDVIRQQGPLPPARVAAIGLDLLAALAAAAEGDVLHLDVKPSNVLMADDGRVVLADFGPAGTHAGVAALAEAGIILGSPRYVAPERLFEGGRSDERSDLWSLGATLYHAVEGRTPFARDTIDETLHAADDGIPDLPELAGPLTPVVLGLLRRDPADRLTADQVRAQLRRIAPAAKRATTVRVGTAIGAAAAVVAFGGVAFATQRSGGGHAGGPAAGHVQAVASAAVPVMPSLAAPTGYTWCTDPAGGFRVAVPRGWRTTVSSGGLVCTAPGGQPVLGVGRWTTKGELVPALIAAEKKARLPGYRRAWIETATEPPGAIWEYTFQDPATGPMRALRRIVTVGGREYRIDWSAPATDWATDLPTLLAILPTVSLAPGG